MKTTAHRDASLALLGGNVGLFKGVSDLRLGIAGITENAYTGYGTRPAITYGAAGNTTPPGGRQVANSGTVTFPKNTGADEPAWGYFDASAATGGVARMYGFFGGYNPFGAAANDVTAETLYAPSHGLIADVRLLVMAAPGMPLPTGLAEGTAYYVLASGLATDSFKVSTTSGGSAVNITALGECWCLPFVPATMAANGTPSFAAGQLIFQE